MCTDPVGSVETSVAFFSQVITVDGLTSLTVPLQRKQNHKTSLMPAVCLCPSFLSLFLSPQIKVICLDNTFSGKNSLKSHTVLYLTLIRNFLQVSKFPTNCTGHRLFFVMM